jgi:hypothetical protein
MLVYAVVAVLLGLTAAGGVHLPRRTDKRTEKTAT